MERSSQQASSPTTACCDPTQTMTILNCSSWWWCYNTQTPELALKNALTGLLMSTLSRGWDCLSSLPLTTHRLWRCAWPTTTSYYLLTANNNTNDSPQPTNPLPPCYTIFRRSGSRASRPSRGGSGRGVCVRGIKSVDSVRPTISVTPVVSWDAHSTHAAMKVGVLAEMVPSGHIWRLFVCFGEQINFWIEWRGKNTTFCVTRLVEWGGQITRNNKNKSDKWTIGQLKNTIKMEVKCTQLTNQGTLSPLNKES